MSRYTDVDALMQNIRRRLGIASLDNLLESEKAIVKEIDSAPSIDIVKCKECRYWEMRNSPRGWCVVHQGYVLPQYFCADGEREGE